MKFKKWLEYDETSTVQDMWRTLEQLCKNDAPISNHLMIFSDAIKDAGREDTDLDFSNKMLWVAEHGKKQPAYNAFGRFAYYEQPQHMISSKDDFYLPPHILEKIKKSKGAMSTDDGMIMSVEFKSFKDALTALINASPWFPSRTARLSR